MFNYTVDTWSGRGNQSFESRKSFADWAQASEYVKSTVEAGKHCSVLILSEELRPNPGNVH